MTLIGVHSISKSFGSQELFEEISFSIEKGDRIGLIGPNGAGKSSLLKILMDMESANEGSISKRKGLKIGYAGQHPEFNEEPILDVLGGSVEAQILLTKVGFTDLYTNAKTLSGGWKKRLDIARALLDEPDLLLLDEPTNHLDLEGILWLEGFLKRLQVSYIIISHDRYFLENICNKIIEINKCFPEGILIADGTMSEYMERKEAFLEAQEKKERGLASTLRNEVAWLKTSPKARTTKSQSRIQKAYKLIDEHASVKKRNEKYRAKIDFSSSERATRKLIVANNLSKTLGGKRLFHGIDFTLSPGTRMGIVGKNGTGKTTLLKMLMGETTPDIGTIKYADDLKIVYFDQHRDTIDPSLTLRKALSTTDTVNYQGKEIHVVGWAKRFLFSSDRLELPVRCLSGGERARILIARLMLQPADVLLLDEPTNDLDIPTLEVMEESLKEFSGALVMISHDRCLMDRVCTNILGIRQDGTHAFCAEYAKWKDSEEDQNQVTKDKTASKKKKLSYKEKEELEKMSEAIEKLEIEMQQLQLEGKYTELAESEKRLEKLFQRWEELTIKAELDC
ncbi:MAG: ABC-F family ATP-binding cassette domain-containing protein [Waddliaceae bacterium]